MQRIVSLVAPNRKITTRSVKMKIRHIENITVDFDEQFISELLVKKVIDEHYDIKYGNFNNRSVSFTVDEDGKIYCKIVFDKTKRNDYIGEEENEAI
jgi:hypothetical protein